MPIDRNSLIRHTPFLFHLTYASAIRRIKRLNRLESAANLMCLGGESTWLRKKRTEMLRFRIDDDQIVLTDQGPLIEANIRFLDGWSLGDLIEAVNRRVFFWRGNEEGLLTTDQGHFGKYSSNSERLVFLRIPFIDAEDCNRQHGPEYCKYNSGGARQHPKTGKSPRGPSTFCSGNEAEFSLKQVREITFVDQFELPQSTEICFDEWTGPWHRFTDHVESNQPASNSLQPNPKCSK